jgi:hypothetical protein
MTPTPPTTMPALHHNHPETEERSDALTLSWTPKHADKFHAMPQVWKQLIARVKEMQQALDLSDGAFTGPLIGGAAWNQLCNGAYRVPTTPRGVEQIEETLLALVERGKDLLIKKAEGRRTAQSLAERFVMRPEYDEVVDCLEDAEANAEDALEERVVILVGGTRCGKSAILAKLISANKVNWRLRATPIMKRSYKKFLIGVGAALKLRELKDSTLAELHDSILGKLEKVRGVLAIEELQSFSPSALEFLKTLLNDTQVSLVISMLPGQFERMTRSTGEDMQQFLGRSVGVVKLKVTTELVASFAPKLWKKCPQATKLQNLLAAEATKGGGMSLLRDVCRDAQLLAEHDGLKEHHITDALRDFRRKVPAMRMTEGRAA